MIRQRCFLIGPFWGTAADRRQKAEPIDAAALIGE
jgi:hypothetical protein